MPDFFMLSSILGWTILSLTFCVTIFVLRGIKNLPKLSVKWRNCFFKSQVLSYLFSINWTIYCTMRAADFGVIDQDTQSDDWQMIMCSGFVTILLGILPLCYCYFIWFWFIRLEIVFAKASNELKVSENEQRFMKLVVWVTHLASLTLMIIFNIPPRKRYKAGMGMYLCRANPDMALTISIASAIGTVSIICLLLYLCVAFIRRFKLVMISGFKHDNAMKGFSENEKLTLRKTVVIAVTSMACSLILLTVFVLKPHLVYLMQFDFFLNTLFIACYFQFGKSLYDRVFCLCERYGNQIDQCCGVDINSVILAEYDNET